MDDFENELQNINEGQDDEIEGEFNDIDGDILEMSAGDNAEDIDDEEGDDVQLPTMGKLKKMKVADIKELLNDAEVDYPVNAKRDDLIKICQENNLIA